MTLPDDAITVEVTGTYVAEDGDTASGVLIFTPSISTIRDPDDDTVLKTRQQRVVAFEICGKVFCS